MEQLHLLLHHHCPQLSQQPLFGVVVAIAVGLVDVKWQLVLWSHSVGFDYVVVSFVLVEQ